MRLVLLLASACTLSTSTSPLRTSSATPVQSPSSPSNDEPTIPPGAIRATGPSVDTRGFYLPVPEHPVDPWAGVVNGKPITLALDPFWWWSRTETVECTAAHDHCLPAASWMWVAEGTVLHANAIAKPTVFTQVGPTRPSNLMPVPPDAFVAFRTVPITKATLVVGARVFAMPGTPIPDDPWADWHVGTVTSVDWDMGFVYLTSAPQQPYFISAVRLPVLQWDATAGVQILDGKPRDSLAVNARDVILPL